MPDFFPNSQRPSGPDLPRKDFLLKPDEPSGMSHGKEDDWTRGSPRLAVRALIYGEDSILLTRHRDDRGDWYLTPGGGVQPGETLHQALVREVREEVGASIAVGETACLREVFPQNDGGGYLPKNFHQVEVFFYCRLLNAEKGSPGERKRPGKPFTEARAGSGGEMLGKHPSGPDKDQTGWEWVSWERFGGILFFPDSLKEAIQNRRFVKIYWGVVD